MATMNPPPAPPPSYYKIVISKTGKSRSLSLVPTNWEVNGTLSWPKLRSDSKVINFIQNHVAPGSVAGVHWITCSAKVLETNIENYDRGNAKLAALLKQQDSSEFTTDNDELIASKRRRLPKTKANETNYSAMMSSLTVSRYKQDIEFAEPN